MLSCVRSQAIPLNQAKKDSPRSRESAPDQAPRVGKSLLGRFFDMLVEGRLRGAEAELRHHRRFYEAHAK
jgi:hypothetical protein